MLNLTKSFAGSSITSHLRIDTVGAKLNVSTEQSLDVSFWCPWGALKAVISMSVVLISKYELRRLDALARLDSEGLTVLAAAGLMNVTPLSPFFR